MKFMYMDESKSDDTGIVALTGLILNDSCYVELRRELFKVLNKYIKSDAQKFSRPPVIHGNNLLPEVQSDAERLSVVKEFFCLVEEYGGAIYRCGYYKDTGIPGIGDSDLQLQGLAFLGLLIGSQAEYENDIIVPIIDGVDPEIARKHGESNHYLQSWLANGMPSVAAPFKNSEHIADLCVIDSRYSILAQCVDVVSYVFHCDDWLKQRKPAQKFKKSIAETINIIQGSVVMNKVQALSWHP